MEDKYKGLDRRQSVRLSRELPSRFMLIDEDKSAEITGVCSGSVRNISAGGALMECYDLSDAWIEGLVSGMIKVAVEIEVPESEAPVRALARAAWFSKIEKDEEKDKEKYILGLQFVDITTASQDIIRNYIIKSYLG
ncbi:MAG: PilZ domain-containing protein [Candidatus Omnitrophota bacterium]